MTTAQHLAHIYVVLYVSEYNDNSTTFNNNNNNNTAFILRHISGHCGHSEAHYKHLHIINNIMIKMHTVKMQDKI